MAGEHVGWCDCAECGAVSPVRKNKNGKLFYMCPECGMIYPNSKAGNARLEKRVRATAEKLPTNSDTGKATAPGGSNVATEAPAVVEQQPAAGAAVPSEETPAPEAPRRRFGGGR